MDYSQGKIYKITSASRPDLIYIGSTPRDIHQRFNEQKYRKNCESKKLIELGDAKIELIHNFPCNSKLELRIEEQRVMDTFPIVVNKIRAYTSEEEAIHQKQKWKEENKEYIAEQRIANIEQSHEYSRQHWIKNKERIKARVDKQVTCECGQEMRKGSLSTHRKRKFHKAYLETLL
jgi:hypothetical protein